MNKIWVLRGEVEIHSVSSLMMAACESSSSGHRAKSAFRVMGEWVTAQQPPSQEADWNPKNVSQFETLLITQPGSGQQLQFDYAKFQKPNFRRVVTHTRMDGRHGRRRNEKCSISQEFNRLPTWTRPGSRIGWILSVVQNSQKPRGEFFFSNSAFLKEDRRRKRFFFRYRSRDLHYARAEDRSFDKSFAALALL